MTRTILEELADLLHGLKELDPEMAALRARGARPPQASRGARPPQASRGAVLTMRHRDSQPLLVYVAHPVGAGTDRTTNLGRARRWLAYLIAAYPEHAFVAPWLAYCDVLEETPANRARGLRDDRAVQRRCDAIALVGGELSPGMRDELAFARAERHDVLDLLALGAEPPQEQT